MNYEKFLKDNLIKKEKPDFRQITSQLKRAQKDLKTAEANLPIDLPWTFAIAYHGMIRASRALIYSMGYLPTANKSHKTIIELTKMILGDKYGSLIGRFSRMRRRRHGFIYDSKNHITPHEAKEAIETANGLIGEIIALVKKENPEADLFQ